MQFVDEGLILWFTRLMTSLNLSKSDAKAIAYDNIQGVHLIGCARCKWVYPGMMKSIPFSALAVVTFKKSTKNPSIFLNSSFSHSRISVATRSFRLRPVCSFPPMFLPMISPNLLSFAV